MEEFIITFRESLEASLIVGIVFSYLWKTKRDFLRKYVYIGIFLGLLGSILGAFGFHALIGGFSGTSEVFFEGITMFLGAGLILYLIIWISEKNTISMGIERRIETTPSLEKGWSLVFLIFILILREGVETTLFLNSLLSAQNSISVMFGFLGIILGFMAGYGVYTGFKGLKLKYMFRISTFFLALFAIGLFARGVHEFQEIGFLPTFVEHLWNTNFIISQNSLFGKFLKSLFSYNPNPSLLEVLAYIGSLIMVIMLYNRPCRVLRKS